MAPATRRAGGPDSLAGMSASLRPGAVPGASFAQFAKLTLKHAQRDYGRTSNEASAVHAGWDTVKVRL
jgi:hypothetical protein